MLLIVAPECLTAWLSKTNCVLHFLCSLSGIIGRSPTTKLLHFRWCSSKTCKVIFMFVFPILFFCALTFPFSGVVKYCVSTPFTDRTDEEAISDMRSLCQDDSLASVRGMKAVSPFINLPGFSAIWAWCPDYMHCVLLGVTRQITDLWLTEAGEFYKGTRTSLLALLNERLCSIRMPQCVNKQPRSLHARGNWKASEWQHWLLHYSVPCISGVLEDEYVEHWGLLVAGVYLLLKDSITDSDVEQSSKLLAQFVVRLQFLYEESQMTYNVHQLLHLAKSAHLFGPLWAHSCFSFESNMGRLLKLVTSSNGVALQIATRLLLHSSFVSLRAVASERALALIGIEETVSHDREEMIPLGKPVSVRETSDFSVPRQQGDELLEYERLKVGRIIICSEKYSRHLRVDCTAVLLKDGTHMKVEKLLCYREPSGRRMFLILSSIYFTEAVMLCEHIKLARKRREKNLYTIDKYIRPCAFFSFAGEMYFSDLPNKYTWLSDVPKGL